MDKVSFGLQNKVGDDGSVSSSLPPKSNVSSVFDIANVAAVGGDSGNSGIASEARNKRPRGSEGEDGEGSKSKVAATGLVNVIANLNDEENNYTNPEIGGEVEILDDDKKIEDVEIEDNDNNLGNEDNVEMEGSVIGTDEEEELRERNREEWWDGSDTDNPPGG